MYSSISAFMVSASVALTTTEELICLSIGSSNSSLICILLVDEFYGTVKVLVVQNFKHIVILIRITWIEKYDLIAFDILLEQIHELTGSQVREYLSKSMNKNIAFF